ncbi:uncharacterized protein LOC125235869 isoform X1 [Leguminivora glycinivorella]|uniref:uncharacterized protein LOC125230704 n=1 Tax=Leguminivora glycinivorella TaxID=1035111 RepID=UPI00200FE18A|nr:uncharacterized protein LOC125230704 [Leguminivora glycinivorella]XP_047998444.1 uncharacterized protein LOC125235869 isoform X1 [Leguminivora glycinivorella]
MSSELSQLKANRGYHKGAITRIGTFCMSEDFKTASIELILQKKERLIKSFNDYELCNRAILALEPEDDESYESYETKRDLCLALIETRLKQVSPAAQATPSSELETSKFKKLPCINIKTFDGVSIMDYHPFVNMFRAVIHKDAKLSTCEKLYYLRSFLAGEALDLIKNLMLNDENYEVALKLLDDRYNNIPKIVNFHVNSILDMPVLTKCTASALRSVVSTVNMHLAALKNLNEKVEFWDTILVNILAKKIDSYTYRGFHLERDVKEVPKLCEFLTFLEKRAIALEATSTEEPKKTVKSTVSAAATMGVSCVPVCLQAADTCGSLLGEDEIRSYCRREAALPCWQEVYK